MQAGNELLFCAKNDKQKENDIGLSYHYTFSAPKSVTPAELEQFVKKVEAEAKKMGFKPTTVFNAVFTTAAMAFPTPTGSAHRRWPKSSSGGSWSI
jgi:hypothetical protein